MVTPDPAQFTPEPSLDPTPTPPRHPLNGDSLLIGDEEPVVVDIQIRLMELNYLEFEQPDDEYSDGTADAVRSFQARNGLHVNGICDKETYEKMFSDDALTYAMVNGSTGDDVEIVKLDSMVKKRNRPRAGFVCRIAQIIHPATSTAFTAFRSSTGSMVVSFAFLGSF